MKWRIGLIVLCIFVFLLISVPAVAVFEVPEGAISFDSLGLSETYSGDTLIYQTKEVTKQFAKPSEIKIVLHTFRSGGDFFEARIYVNGLLATGDDIYGGNQETTLIIPGAFLQNGENRISLEFIESNEYQKFSKFPLTIAPKSYILSIDLQGIPTPTSEQTPTPTITPTITSIEIENLGFATIAIIKSSETAPEINIESIKELNSPDEKYVLSGSAHSDSGIKNVTINGQYVGTEHWSVNLSGDNNTYILITGNDGNTTAANISFTDSSSQIERESWISKNFVSILTFIFGSGIIGIVIKIIMKYRRKNKIS